MIKFVNRLWQRFSLPATKSYMQTLPAGRERDRRIAIELMGWTYKTWHDSYDNTIYSYLLRTPEQTAKEAIADRLPAFSTNQLDADAVANALRSDGWMVEITQVSSLPNACSVKISRDNPYQITEAWANTIPHAVCLAALKTTA